MTTKKPTKRENPDQKMQHTGANNSVTERSLMKLPGTFRNYL